MLSHDMDFVILAPVEELESERAQSVRTSTPLLVDVLAHCGIVGHDQNCVTS
jgi:hypothetical protein